MLQIKNQKNQSNFILKKESKKYPMMKLNLEWE